MTLKTVLDKVAGIKPDWISQFEVILFGYLLSVHLIAQKDVMLWTAVGWAVYGILKAVDTWLNASN